jgi:hypothetical protein
MNKILISFLIVASAVGSSFSSDCEQLKLELKKEKIIKTIDIGCFVISSAVALFALYPLSMITDPPKNAEPGKQYGLTEKQKIEYGIIGIVACVSVAFEIPIYWRHKRKSNRIEEEMELNCNLKK